MKYVDAVMFSRALILVGMLSLAACIDEPTFELADQRTEETVSIDPTTPPTSVDAGASGRTPDAATPLVASGGAAPAPKPAPKPAPRPAPAPRDDDDDGDNGKGKDKDD